MIKHKSIIFICDSCRKERYVGEKVDGPLGRKMCLTCNNLIALHNGVITQKRYDETAVRINEVFRDWDKICDDHFEEWL